MFMVRQARPEDRVMCEALSATYTTKATWQISLEGRPTRYDHAGCANDLARLSFHMQQVRLPRTRTLRLPSSITPLVGTWHGCHYHLAAFSDDGEGETLCGYLLLALQPDRQQALMVRFLVDEPFRGQGVGTALLQAARAWGGEEDLQVLVAHAPLRNVPGIEFYQRRGFRLCGLQEHFYPTREDALFLSQNV